MCHRACLRIDNVSERNHIRLNVVVIKNSSYRRHVYKIVKNMSVSATQVSGERQRKETCLEYLA